MALHKKLSRSSALSLRQINDMSQLIPDSTVMFSGERAWCGLKVIHNRYSYREWRVREYIDEHLEDDLSLSTLAEVTAMSSHHFARQLKQQVYLRTDRHTFKRSCER